MTRTGVDSNQELVAVGVVSIASGFIGGLTANGSMSETAVNDGTGAKTQLALLVAAITLLTVLVLTPSSRIYRLQCWRR